MKFCLRALCIAVVNISLMQDGQAFGIGKNGEYTTGFDAVDAVVKSHNIAIANKENTDAAKEMEKRGKSSFLRQDHARAISDYSSARTLLPKPEYYFIVGDLKLRASIFRYKGSRDRFSAEKSCWIRNAFQAETQNILVNDYDVGIYLTSRFDSPRLENSEIYKQAIFTAKCVFMLRNHYAEGVNSSRCVPSQKIEACLGKPLLFLHR